MKRFNKIGTNCLANNENVLSKICRSIGPIYYICRIMGVWAIHVKAQGETIVLKSGKRDWLYFITHIVTYSSLSAYSLWCLMNDDSNYNVISHTVVIIECCIMIALEFLTLFFGFIFRKLVVDSLQLTSAIDSNFSTIGVTLDYNVALKKSLMIFAVMCGSVMVRSLLMLTTVSIDIGQQSSLFIAALIKSLSKYQFIVLALMVSNRFEMINSNIKSMYKNKSNISVLSHNKHIDRMTIILYTLCRLHYKLCNVTRILNKAFAWQLLISLGVSLSDILFQSYYLYVSFSGRVPGISLNKICCAIAWILDEILEVYFLVYACATTCNNANKTSVILHELRNSYKSTKLENHVQMYSLQMLHQKIQFSALGFFVMDYSLIYSIIGAVTTYLVIFIQFDQNQANAQASSASEKQF